MHTYIQAWCKYDSMRSQFGCGILNNDDFTTPNLGRERCLAIFLRNSYKRLKETITWDEYM